MASEMWKLPDRHHQFVSALVSLSLQNKLSTLGLMDDLSETLLRR
jgi:hypothetical protein